MLDFPVIPIHVVVVIRLATVSSSARESMQARLPSLPTRSSPCALHSVSAFSRFCFVSNTLKHFRPSSVQPSGQKPQNVVVVEVVVVVVDVADNVLVAVVVVVVVVVQG